MNYNLLKDIIEWDVLNWSQLISVWQPIIERLPKESKILAVGERNGGLSLWLALQGFRVECTDRVSPTDIAKSLHEKYNVSGNITYKTTDIVNDHLPPDEYDLVIMKSVFGGLKIDPSDPESRSQLARQKAIENIYNSLKPSGYLFSADNMQGSVIVHTIRVKKHKNKGWHYFTIPEINELFSCFPSFKANYFGVIPGLFQNDLVNRIIYFMNKYILFWMSANSRYIGIFVASK